MRNIAIIGGGHAGLQLGVGLLKNGYKVTVVTDREPDAVRKGRILSSQGMQKIGLDHERNLGLDFWDAEAPKLQFYEYSKRGEGGERSVYWRATRSGYGNSVDQRLKIPRWTEEFVRLGGALQILQAEVADIDRLSEKNDLVLIASGKGDIGKLFERDASRSPYDKPQRSMALTYVKGMTPTTPKRGTTYNAAPGIGEYFIMPALTTSGECDVMVFEGLIGGPMDCWSDLKSPSEHLQRCKEVVEKFFPWEYERCRNIELTDENGTLSGRFAPTVRKPVAQLPSGRLALGIADAVMLNDPLTGQGSNNASKFAAHYLQRILARKEEPFDRQWMEEAFESYWQENGCLTTEFSNRMLAFTPEMHEVFDAAQGNDDIAQRIAGCFNNPPSAFPWLFESKVAERMFGELTE